MTEESPASGADLRRRVLARIAAGDAPRRTWRAAWVLSPIAAAALIAIAVFVARPARHDTVRLRPSPLPGFGTTATTESAAVPPDAARPKSAVQMERTVVARLQQTDRLPPSPLPGFGATNTTVVAPKLSDIDPLTTPRLAVESLDLAWLRQTDSISVQKLDPVPPIDVTPIGISPEGDRP